MALLFFLATARRGVSVLSPPSRFRDITVGVIFPLTDNVRQTIDKLDFFALLDDSSWDLKIACLAYVRSSEVDRSAAGSVGWYRYNFRQGTVLSVPSFTSKMKKRDADEIPWREEKPADQPSFIADRLFSMEKAAAEVRRGFHQPEDGPPPEPGPFPSRPEPVDDDEDLRNLDDLEPVPGSATNFLNEVLRVGSELELYMP